MSRDRISHRRTSWPSEPIQTSYSTVELIPDIGATGVLVVLDGVQSSHLNLADPTQLAFEYMQHMQAVIKHTPIPSSSGRLRVLHLGGAGCAMALAIHAEWPNSHQVVVEIDEILARLVRDWFTLPRSPHLRIRVQDAGEAIATSPAHRYEIIIRDAFEESDVPSHLMTTDFTAKAARALSPNGVYLANLTDSPPLLVARREAATVSRSFRHTAVIIEPGVLRGRRYGNIVIVGSARPLPAKLHRKLGVLPAPARLLQGEDVARFIGSHQALRTEEFADAETVEHND